MGVLHSWNTDFRLFCFCDLDLYPMPFIYELNPYSLETYRVCKYELTYVKVFRKLSSDRQTNRQRGKHDRNCIPPLPRRFAGGQNLRKNRLMRRSYSEI